MFWALAQWQKDKDAAAKERRQMRARAKARGWAKGYAEGWAEGLAEGRKEGYRQGIMNIWNSAQSAEEREFVRRCAGKLGVILPAQ